MTYKEVATMVASVGVPSAYYQFKETIQGPPFICFFFMSGNDLLADNKNYQKIERLAVELYTDEKDYSLEAVTESVLEENGLVYSKEDDYIDSERMHVTVYEMDVIITSEV